MKKISILGATGSIGTSTLEVVRQHREEFEVIGLSGGRNLELMVNLVEEFRPKVVSMATKELAVQLSTLVKHKVHIVYGEDGLMEVATHPDTDFVLSAIVGFAGLKPTLAAIQAGKEIGLANKETLVSAGHIVMEKVRAQGVRLIPVDSEHSAIFQCLQGERHSDVERIILTASGGALRHLTRDQLPQVSIEEALNHPNWKMGAKVTIDSATLMNKGLEVIEAHWLFSLPFSHIDVVIHYESIIHSMVEFKDGAVMAQLGTPDMKVPIQYALSYPGRIPLNTERLNLAKIGKLHFKEVDIERYPALRLAYQVGESGGTYPTVLNAANEELVAAVLQGRLPFYRIESHLEEILNLHQSTSLPSLDEIIAADQWAREEVSKRLHQL